MNPVGEILQAVSERHGHTEALFKVLVVLISLHGLEKREFFAFIVYSVQTILTSYLVRNS